MADDVTRDAARLATVITVPVMLAAILLAFFALSGHDDTARDGDAGNGDAGNGRGVGASPSPPVLRATGPVEMPAATLDARRTVVCRALLAELPSAIQDLPQRPVSAGAEQNAAYGDPPITLACGTSVPSFAPTDTISLLDGVCWYPVQRGDATAWTTLDREVPVTVTVPAHYDQPGQWVIEFSAPVAAAVPRADTVTYGCRPGG